MRSDIVRLFQTLPHACGYYADREAQNLVIDPASPQLSNFYELGLQRGYRRAGSHVYVPHCAQCRACVACRIPVSTFAMDRAQRRCVKRNTDLQVDILPARYSDERFDLYRRYLQWRHPNGGMDNAQTDDFSRFLYTEWSPTQFVEFRHRGKLLAVAVTDFCRAGLSSVYTFYEPDVVDRGLGTFAILEQIRIAREFGLDHVYLGFWIAGHPKMDYKIRFRPIEVLRAGEWVVLEKSPREARA
ncbi:arginyltransferase [Dokdonella sp.]|uniref:arginyltransferase n=1 Tax=Dokdonella sp. TaxID=2291710 RepID=UPI0035277894